MSKGLEVLATGKKRTKIAATLDGGNALISKQEVEIIEKELKEKEKQDDYIKSLEDRIDNLETSYLRDRKALDIIKELFIFQPDKFNPFAWKELNVAPKEKIDLLKEVLL